MLTCSNIFNPHSNPTMEGLLSPFYRHENRGTERLSNSPQAHSWRVAWDWNIGFQIGSLSVEAPLHAVSGPPAFPNPQVYQHPSLTGMRMPSDLYTASGSVLRETSLTMLQTVQFRSMCPPPGLPLLAISSFLRCTQHHMK